MHNVGDIVVVRYSKGKILKNRLLKVLSKGSYDSHVVNIKGHHSDHGSYRLRTLKEMEQQLMREVEKAGVHLDKCKERLRDFQAQAKDAESHFPKV